MITQLHSCHSFITHSFLLNGEEPPVCTGCDERLTIEHILHTCSDCTEIRLRESHFADQSLCVLFQEISLEKFELSERYQ